MSEDQDCKNCLNKTKIINDLKLKLKRTEDILGRQKDIVMSSVAYEQMAIEVLKEIGIDLISEESAGLEGKGRVIKGFFRCRACHLRWEAGAPALHKDDCRLDEVIVQSEKQL